MRPFALQVAPSLDILTALLDRGADPTLPNEKGVTPLMLHSLFQNVDNVARLLQEPRVRAIINAQDVDGDTALICACFDNDEASATSIFHLLLQAGANPRITKNNGETPLAFLRQRHRNHYTTIALLEQAPEAEKASLLVKARRLIAVSRNAEAPAYLQNRVLQGLPLPHVALMPVAGGTTDEIEEPHKLHTMLLFLLGMGDGPEDEGMPRDVFRVVLDFLMPSWNPLRRRTGLRQPMQA